MSIINLIIRSMMKGCNMKLPVSASYRGETCFNCSLQGFIHRSGISSDDMIYINLASGYGFVLFVICYLLFVLFNDFISSFFFIL